MNIVPPVGKFRTFHQIKLLLRYYPNLNLSSQQYVIESFKFRLWIYLLVKEGCVLVPIKLNCQAHCFLKLLLQQTVLSLTSNCLKYYFDLIVLMLIKTY